MRGGRLSQQPLLPSATSRAPHHVPATGSPRCPAAASRSSELNFIITPSWLKYSLTALSGSDVLAFFSAFPWTPLSVMLGVGPFPLQPHRLSTALARNEHSHRKHGPIKSPKPQRFPGLQLLQPPYCYIACTLIAPVSSRALKRRRVCSSRSPPAPSQGVPFPCGQRTGNLGLNGADICGMSLPQAGLGGEKGRLFDRQNLPRAYRTAFHTWATGPAGFLAGHPYFGYVHSSAPAMQSCFLWSCKTKARRLWKPLSVLHN